MIDLVTVGANTLIARHIGEWATRHGWSSVDLSGVRDCTQELAGLRPRSVVHTAGGPNEADWIRTSIVAVADACDRVGARCCLVSSDVVFSGRRLGSYPTDARPDPVHPYGQAKAFAEEVILARPGALVVRTSLTITSRLDGPQEALVRRALDGDRSIVFFDDEIRSPLDVDDLAAAIGELAATGSTGIRHVVGTHPLSRFELATVIATAMARPTTSIMRGSSDGSRPRRISLAPSTLRTRIRPVDRSWVARALALH